jgi:glycosyltransferase involved in cell wall biosynthesis
MLGKTGSLVSDVDEMAEAIQATAHLDRVLCWKTAIERFSANRMTRQYIELYRRIIGRAN